MKKLKIENMTTDRETQAMLFELDQKWKRALSIKNSRRRFREIMKIRKEAKDLLEKTDRIRRNKNSQNVNFFSDLKKKILRWLSVAESSYK